MDTVDIDDLTKYINNLAVIPPKLSEEQEAKHKSQEAQAHADGWEQFYKLRNRWSTFILWCIGILIAFQICITLAIGLGYLSYLQQYNWFMPVVLTENFIQIIGLALILVKFLFTNHSSK